MTREEAIQELQNCKGLIQQDGQDYLDDRDIPIIDMAIEALSERNIARDIATIIENEQDMRVMLQVVRCKDCRFYNPIDENKPYPCGYGMYMCNKDDFCSYGERREP